MFSFVMARFEAPASVTLKITVDGIVTPCRVVYICLQPGGALHISARLPVRANGCNGC
jgi:hypothetical protein